MDDGEVRLLSQEEREAECGEDLHWLAEKRAGYPAKRTRGRKIGMKKQQQDAEPVSGGFGVDRCDYSTWASSVACDLGMACPIGIR